MYFQKYRLRKILLDKCLKSRVSKDPLTENAANGLKHCSNLNERIFWKKFLLVIHKILTLFVNTLTAGEKHYLFNRDNLTQPSQIQLSQKQKSFSELFFSFLKSILNFKHVPKKMTLVADVFLEIPAQKNMVR